MAAMNDPVPDMMHSINPIVLVVTKDIQLIDDFRHWIDDVVRTLAPVIEEIRHFIFSSNRSILTKIQEANKEVR
jgi:hypothetical protein